MTHSDAPDDAALLWTVAQPWSSEGRRAMAMLYDRHAAGVRSALQRLAPGRPALVDDCVQDAFVVAHRHAARFTGQSARPWLVAIGARRLRDHLRGESRRRAREAAHAAEAERRTEAPAVDPELEEAIARLAPRDRVVLELRFVQGLSHAEVAESLGVSLRTAKGWAGAALERLRAAIGEGVR